MNKLSLAALLLAMPCWAGAQQSMPGMNMGGQAQQKPEQPKQAMPGMNMQKPQTMQMPKDMQMPSGQQNDKDANQASQSIKNSEQQQKAQQGVKPGPGSDAQSVTHNTLQLQEPENPDHLTGRNLPAPELLNEVVKRAPMSVEDFVSLGEKTNPTLAQVRSYVRRSEQQGRQAGLYPNPSVGYSGEHIRGGDYGGGEQGAYVQQEIVLGGKLSLRRKIYQQQARADQIGLDEQTYRVKNNVQQAFYQALTSQATVILRQRLLKVADDAVETAHQLSNVGQADAPDVLQAQVEAQQAQVDFVRAQREFLQDFHTLAAVAGALDLAPSPLKGDLEQPPQLNAEQQVATVIADSLRSRGHSRRSLLPKLA
jgi:outer membrane protein, heavy metal efflux system